MIALVRVSVEVNGARYEREVEPRLLLSDFLRQELGLTGTHVGCEHGVCGACTVLLDGEAVRSCLLFAVQSGGRTVRTIEGLAPSAASDGAAADLHPLQAAFREAHALQCGFCTPGILMSLVPFLDENPHPSRDEIRHALTGNLCRCTGYQKIVDAVEFAAAAASPARAGHHALRLQDAGTGAGAGRDGGQGLGSRDVGAEDGARGE
jgi:carbon-monoxide dehydrogenase small subunit